MLNKWKRQSFARRGYKKAYAFSKYIFSYAIWLRSIGR